jgi:hypothetical protein
VKKNEKPTRSVPETWGRMYNLAKILEVATKIRETCEKTLFTPSSPVKATKLYCFCLSGKRSQNCQSILSDKILLKSLSLF